MFFPNAATVRSRLVRLATVVAAVAIVVLPAAPALAAEGRIDLVQSKSGETSVLFSIPGLTDPASVDFASVRADFDGQDLPATAAFTDEDTLKLKRTTVLAIDISESMLDFDRFTAAKQAAIAYLDTVPGDVNVGIVTFNGTVTLQQAPSQDREESRRIIEGLVVDRGTKMYEGIKTAAAATGTVGQRRILLLTDGRDVSGKKIKVALDALTETKTKLDAVSLGDRPEDLKALREIAKAGDGETYEKIDPQQLSEVFAQQAQGLAQQLLVTIDTNALPAINEGNLKVSIEAAGETYTDAAYVTIRQAEKVVAEAKAESVPSAAPQGVRIPQWVMVAGIAALGLGAFVLVLGMNNLLAEPEETLQDRIAQYTRRGAPGYRVQEQAPAGVRAQAVGVADKLLGGTRGFQDVLAHKLDAANLSIIPPEWLLIHFGIAIGTMVGSFLLTAGNPIFLLVGLVLGLLGPWLFLTQKESRRIARFKSQLADTLQLMSGSLSAGMSLQQSVDSIVREGAEPMASEFRKAIIDTRLGVPIEDALDAVAERMQSKDFTWVVMAVRIQREVGGNLAELLNNVAATIRDREYLERQVAALSAEGRLSVWILGGLAPGFLLYLLIANPTYLSPMFTTLIGNVLLGVVAILITVGVFWMRKLVKVEV